MQIQSVRDTKLGDRWKVTLDDGRVFTVPQNPNNRHARVVLEWIDAGGTVDPYVPPAGPTPDEKIDRQNEVFIAFLKVYAYREGVTPAQIKNAIKAEL